MKRRVFFVALAIALPLALILPLRAARSWQPRVLELPYLAFADTTEFFWRANGLTLVKYKAVAPPLAMRNWDGTLVPIGVLPAQSASLDRSGKQTARLYPPGGSSVHIELWDMKRAQLRRAATAQLHARNAGKNYMNRLNSNSSVAISPDGTRVAWPALKPYGVIIATTTTGRETARFMVPARDANGTIRAREVLALAWSPDQNQLAVVGSTYVAIVDAANGKQRHFWRKSERYTNRLIWSPDGKKLALAWGHDSVIYTDGPTGGPQTSLFLFVHDAQNGALISSWSDYASNPTEAQGITNLDFSPDGAQLAWGTYNGQALVMNPESGAIEQRFGLQISPNRPPGVGPMTMGGSSNAQYVAYSPDGRTLALASIYRVVLQRVR